MSHYMTNISLYFCCSLHLPSPSVIALDDNLHLRSMRYQFYQMARKCWCRNNFIILCVCLICKTILWFIFYVDIEREREESESERARERERERERDVSMTQSYADCLGFAELCVCCDVTVAQARNSKRQTPIPDATIVSMEQRLELPEPAKHHWEKQSAAVHSNRPKEEFLSHAWLATPIHQHITLRYLQ